MTLHHEMERLGRILAADQRIDVEVKGRSAYAVKGKLVLPAIERFSELGENANRMLHGLLDHEAGHARFTDFDVLERKTKVPPLVRSIHNALEDGYVEHQQAKAWPGVSYNLVRKNEWFWNHAFDALEGKTGKQHLAMTDYLTAAVFALALIVREHGGRTVTEVLEARAELAGFLSDAASLVEEAKQCFDSTKGTTAKLFTIAEQIYEVLQKHASKHELPEKKPVPFPKSGVKKDDDEEPAPASAEEPSAEEENDSESDEEVPGDAPAEDRPADEASEEDSTSAASSDAEEDDEPADLSEYEIDAVTPEAVCNEEVSSRVDGETSYVVFSSDYDIDQTEIEPPAKTVPWFKEVEEQLMDSISSFAVAFDVALRSRRERRPMPGADEGDVDPLVLGEYAAGALPADQMYTQYVAEDDTDVAVAILIDCSGSMDTKQAYEYAAQTAYVVSRALQMCQIPHEITGFTTCEGKARAWSARSDAFELPIDQKVLNKHIDELHRLCEQMPDEEKARYARHFHRMQPQVRVHMVFKSYESTDLRNLQWVAPYQENLDGEAVLWQAQRLAARPERRRVLFVLSDGEPSGSRDDALGQKYLKEVVERVVDAGIEVYGFGIRSTAVTKYYPLSVVINDLDELVSTVVERVTSVLLEGRMEQRTCSV